MDIFAFAMKMEKDGETFYRDLAQKTANQGIANIFEMLADEEVKHYRTIKSLQFWAGRKISSNGCGILMTRSRLTPARSNSTARR
jgi:rubrerythrin